MPRFVAFLRSVNVGGRTVRMAGLRRALEDAGFTGVETHIQSGNVLVGTTLRSAASVRRALEEAVEAYAGFAVPAVVRTPSAVRALVAEVDGVPPMLGEGSRRYVALADAPVPAAAAAELEAWDRPGERVRVLGDSILAEVTVPFHTVGLTNARVDRITGLTTTWRDLRVVRAVDERWGA